MMFAVTNDPAEVGSNVSAYLRAFGYASQPEWLEASRTDDWAFWIGIGLLVTPPMVAFGTLARSWLASRGPLSTAISVRFHDVESAASPESESYGLTQLLPVTGGGFTDHRIMIRSISFAVRNDGERTIGRVRATLRRVRSAARPDTKRRRSASAPLKSPAIRVSGGMELDLPRVGHEPGIVEIPPRSDTRFVLLELVEVATGAMRLTAVQRINGTDADRLRQMTGQMWLGGLSGEPMLRSDGLELALELTAHDTLPVYGRFYIDLLKDVRITFAPAGSLD